MASQKIDFCPVPGEAVSECTVTSCFGRCALAVIDELLCLPRAEVSGEEVDLLLDLRWQLRQRTEAEKSLRVFCDLRRRMEQRHYLAFFRLRRWLENHLVAAVRIGPAGGVREVPVKVNHYCVEAIRRVGLCACLEYGPVVQMPRLRFAFRPVVTPPSGPVQISQALSGQSA